MSGASPPRPGWRRSWTVRLSWSYGGLTVTRHPTPCSTAGSPFPALTSVAPQAPHGLALLCTGQGYTGHTDKTVYVSGDLGATWTLAGRPGSAGDGGTIGASAPGRLTIATTSASSWLYYSADNGRTWRTAVTYLDGGQGSTTWGSPPFVTAWSSTGARTTGTCSDSCC